jgi:4-amino-4-deoxy-L-arabinose transferase-like glycosyltransferase
VAVNCAGTISRGQIAASPQSLIPSPYLVFIIAAVLYLAPLLLHAPLTDPDEGLHAAISQEMVERGDLVVPRFLGRPFFDKPVLFFWAQAASMRGFGMSTAAARLPGLLFGLLGIATTGWLARVLFNARLGWIAAACYATMLLPFLLAQVPVHDIALVPFTNLALGLLWRSRDPGSGIRDPILAGCALGLSILTKGLEGIAIVGVSYAVYLLVMRMLTPRFVLQGVLVLAVAVLVALPWYLAMNLREPGYLHYYFVDRHLLGFATETQRHGGQAWWYYLPVVIGGGFPWVVLAARKMPPFTKWALLDPADRLLWTWLGTAVVLLSLSNSKAVIYILPAMPAIAILASRSATTQRRWRPIAIVATVVYASALVTLGSSTARAHTARDLADYFNREGRLPSPLFVMEQRVSFVYYLRPDVRARLVHDQIRSHTLDELEAIQPFPSGAVLALPADLADERLARLPQLKEARRELAGRYMLITR